VRPTKGWIVSFLCVLTTTMAAADEEWGNGGQRPTHGVSARSAAFSLVGFSETTTQGDVGLFALHSMCQESFGEMSRTCTMKEVQRSVRIPSLPNTAAWLNSEKYEAVTVQTRLADCAGWTGVDFITGAEGVGTVVDSLGRLERANCFEFHPVSCCSAGY
jgi:hypothetical protein